MSAYSILGCSLAKEIDCEGGKEAGRGGKEFVHHEPVTSVPALGRVSSTGVRQASNCPPRVEDKGKAAPCQHASCCPGCGRLCQSQDTRP